MFCFFYSGYIQHLVLWQEGLSTDRSADGEVRMIINSYCMNEIRRLLATVCPFFFFLSTCMHELNFSVYTSCFTSHPGLWNRKQTMLRERHQRGQRPGEPMESQNHDPLTSWSCSAKPRRNTKEWGSTIFFFICSLFVCWEHVWWNCGIYFFCLLNQRPGIWGLNGTKISTIYSSCCLIETYLQVKLNTVTLFFWAMGHWRWSLSLWGLFDKLNCLLM